MLHRNLEEWLQLRRQREGDTTVRSAPAPTLEDVRREYAPSPVNEEEEVTELRAREEAMVIGHHLRSSGRTVRCTAPIRIAG
jgi:hypothetical protein